MWPSEFHNSCTRDPKSNLDVFWLKGEAPEESANPPAQGIIAQEIMDDLEAALEQFAPLRKT